MNKLAVKIVLVLSLVLMLTGAAAAQDDVTEFVVMVGESFVTMDSTVLGSSNAQSTLFVGLLEPLIRLELDGSFSPALATDWAVSDDGLTYTLTLREGVVFHDGTPWNAEAAVWNLNAARSDEFGGSHVPEFEAIESVEALDEYTVQIKLSHTQPVMLTVLTGIDSRALMISPTAYETMGPDEYAQHPIGTGPFKFVSQEPGVNVVVERNENYWGEIGSNADRIIFQIIVDTSAGTLNYQSGDVHVAFPAQESEVPLMQAVSGTVVESFTAGFVMLQLNNQIPPFDNVHNRRALRYAIDVDPIIALVYGGAAVPAQGMISPGSIAYSADTPPVIQRDLDAARAELEAAGNPDGYTFEVSVVAQPYRTQTLEIMQASLAEVGINLIIQANERARHLDILRVTPNDANAAFNQQIRFQPMPEKYIVSHLGCNPVNAMTVNCTDEWKALEDQLLVVSDPLERAKIVQQLDEIAVRDVIGLPYAYPRIPLVYRGDILENVGVNGYLFLDWVNIDVIGG